MHGRAVREHGSRDENNSAHPIRGTGPSSCAHLGRLPYQLRRSRAHGARGQPGERRVRLKIVHRGRSTPVGSPRVNHRARSDRGLGYAEVHDGLDTSVVGRSYGR